MLVLALSYFDSKVGPMVFLNVPELPSRDILEEIPRLLDFYQEGFFIYEFGDLRTSNLIFTISSPIARGGVVNLMISIIVFDDENIDLSIFQETLKQFVHELKQIKDIYKAFERDKKNSIDNREISTKVEELLNSVYYALPKETISTEKKEINLAMFDFFGEGESKLAQLFRNFITNVQYYKGKSEDLNLLNYKITVYSYPISNSKKSIDFFLSQLKKNQGIIFAVDVTNKMVIRKARHISNRIIRLAIGKLNMPNIPCLVLVNKLGFYRYEIQKILRFLDKFGYDIKTVKYIPTNVSNKDKINEAFNWIIDRVIFKKLKYQKEQKLLPIP